MPNSFTKRVHFGGKVGLDVPNSASCGKHIGPILASWSSWQRLGRVPYCALLVYRARAGPHCPNLVESGPNSAESGPNAAGLGRGRAPFDQIWGELDRHRPSLAHDRPNLALTRQIVATSRLYFGQLRTTSAEFGAIRDQSQRVSTPCCSNTFPDLQLDRTSTLDGPQIEPISTSGGAQDGRQIGPRSTQTQDRPSWTVRRLLGLRRSHGRRPSQVAAAQWVAVLPRAAAIPWVEAIRWAIAPRITQEGGGGCAWARPIAWSEGRPDLLIVPAKCSVGGRPTLCGRASSRTLWGARTSWSSEAMLRSNPFGSSLENMWRKLAHWFGVGQTCVGLAQNWTVFGPSTEVVPTSATFAPTKIRPSSAE